MKTICTFFLLCLSLCFGQLAYSEAVSNEELITLLQVAVEKNDEHLLKEVINAFLDTKRDGSYELLHAIYKYNTAGKLDYAVHDAIKSNDLVSAFILSYYSKDINKRLDMETIWTKSTGTSKSGSSREGKNALELALDQDMKPLISFLLGRGADFYQMRKIGFVYKGEEVLDFIWDVFPNAIVVDRACITTKKEIVVTSHVFKRNFIGDLIAKNRLDIIQIIGERSIDWDKPCLEFYNQLSYTPLQYALLMKREDIVLYLVMNGAFK